MSKSRIEEYSAGLIAFFGSWDLWAKDLQRRLIWKDEWMIPFVGLKRYTYSTFCCCSLLNLWLQNLLFFFSVTVLVSSSQGQDTAAPLNAFCKCVSFCLVYLNVPNKVRCKELMSSLSRSWYAWARLSVSPCVQSLCLADWLWCHTVYFAKVLGLGRKVRTHLKNKSMNFRRVYQGPWQIGCVISYFRT